MNRHEVLQRLEERLARGEISEQTYLGIKARYESTPEAPPAPEAPSAPEPPIPPVPPGFVDHPEHAGHPGEVRVKKVKFANGDFQAMIERTIESAMEQVAAGLEAAFSNKEEVREKMDEVNRRVQEAVSKIGPRIEEGGKVCVIRGSGTVEGGQRFEEFKCAGSATVKGDLIADVAHISGVCMIEGRCTGGEFHASGRAEIAKDVEVEEFHVSGRANVGGDVRAEEVSISGAANIGGGIVDAEDVNFAGAVRIGGGVEAEEFNSRGRFEIGGKIEAEEVNIQLSGVSKVPAIKAEEIEVRRGSRDGQLIAETIEGEEVYLESTRADTVRGRSVRLGPYCSVKTVEAEELEVHETSTFKERKTRSVE